ncbi:MAG TPA: hypothetical protein PKZ22_07620 [Accumulibacter sp.]|nr:hypothetical protein [Accumulibacter sp.]
MIYTGLMLEMCLLLLVAAVFLPDVVFGCALAVLWLAEKLVVGACQVISTGLALWDWGAGRIGNASSRRRLPPAAP